MCHKPLKTHDSSGTVVLWSHCLRFTVRVRAFDAYVVSSASVLLAAQAMQAAKELQRNLAADNAGLVYIWRVWCATVTAHQMVCGDLAAWPW